MHKLNLFLLFPLTVACSITACAPEAARIRDTDKVALLKARTVFASSSVEIVDPTRDSLSPTPGNQPPMLLDPVKPSDPLVNPKLPPIAEEDPLDPRRPPTKIDPSKPDVISYPTKNECSNNETSKAGYNLKQLTSVKIVFFDSSNRQVCSIVDSKIREKLINEKKLEIESIKSRCPNLKQDSSYELAAVAPDIAISTPDDKRNLFTQGFRMRLSESAATRTMATTFVARKDSDPTESRDPVAVLYDRNPSSNGVESPELCDWTHSPLVLQLNDRGLQPKKIDLTAPLSGVMFDILGLRSFPVAYTKKMVSWFTPQNIDEHFFLALPDDAGRILGIDQLFGDNTLGPDQKFASNGFKALAKFDGRLDNGRIDSRLRDGYIDNKDPVFQKLVLWSDRNLDGTADRSEIYSLNDKQIEFIDLSYDRRYYERDIYHNETKYKSVVKSAQGLHLIYDLWFRPI